LSLGDSIFLSIAEKFLLAGKAPVLVRSTSQA
jgi:hypothetical protein